MLRGSLSRRWLRGGLLLVLSGASGSCKGCRDEKPYTPFGVTSALPTSEAPAAGSGSAAPSASGSPRPAVKKALFAPAAAQRWSIEGRELASPGGRVFEQALVADFNADGAREVVAWTLPAPDATDSAAGELWLYPEAGQPRKLLDFPGFLPTGAHCTPVTALAQTAPRTLTVDVRVACSTQLIGRAPTRALLIVDPFSERSPRFGLRAADPALGEVLALDLVSRDEDGDGRDDYRLEVGVATGGKPLEVSASLVFLDRAAGVSRDPREPGRSLLELLKKDTGRSQKKKTAALALSHVDAARRLLAALCTEGATPRVFDWAGNPLRCGALSDVVDRLAAIEVSAALALDDFTAALAALSRDGWYFGAMRPALRAQLVKDIEKRLPTIPAARITLGARPKAFQPPSFSPLSFEASGALLVQTDAGLYRLASDGAREEPVPPEADALPWPLEVTTSSGARWLGVAYSCDRAETSLLFSTGASEPKVIPLLAPRPGVCGGGALTEGFAPTPASVGADVEALIGGAPFGAKNPSPTARGAARSANGERLAIPTPLGLWVQGATGELWKIDSFSGASGCVVDDAGRRAACVRAGKAELYLKSEAP